MKRRRRLLSKTSVVCRQHSEMEELRRRMEENSCMAGRVFREELDKTREEQERRHQVGDHQPPPDF